MTTIDDFRQRIKDRFRKYGETIGMDKLDKIEKNMKLIALGYILGAIVMWIQVYI